MRYPNIFFTGIGILCALALGFSGGMSILVHWLGLWGYFGAFILGFFYSSSFTTAIATVGLWQLGEFLNPWLVALLGGIGAALGDVVWYRIFKEGLFSELKEVIGSVFKHKVWLQIIESRIAYMSLPVLGALIIASPLPDEIGVAFFALRGFEEKKLALLVFILNSIGILLISIGGNFFK